jgi:RND family efflux transporter MFP subunit
MRALNLLLSSAAIMAVAGCGPSQPPQAPAMPPPAVTVDKPVKKTVVDKDEYVGRFNAAESVEVRARVSGYLDSISFRDGESVDKGQLLFTIDKRPYQSAVDQANADIARARARVESSTADVVRSERLIKEGNISDQLYEQRIAAKKDADASLLAAEASLRRAQLDLEFTELRSPVAGRIGDHRVSVGNLVTGGTTGNTTLLANIVSLDPIFFEFTIDESAYLRFMRLPGIGSKRGIPVDLKLVDDKDFVHTGTIDFVDNVIDQSSGTIRLRAVLDNPKGLFTPGMFGKVRVATSMPYEALLVPDAAVLSDQSRKVLMSVTPDDTVIPKLVQLGPVVDGLRVIRSGVSAEDTIIVNGLLRARPGSKVTPQQPGQQAQNAGAPPAQK